MKTLDELDRLHAAALPGEWVHDERNMWGCVQALASETGILLTVSRAAGGNADQKATAAYIAAAKNAWPAFSARLRAAEALVAKAVADNTPRPLDEWHEDFGPVLWWRFPISEPPYVGTPNDDDWPVMATATGGTEPFATHWTRLLIPEAPR